MSSEVAVTPRAVRVAHQAIEGVIQVVIEEVREAVQRPCRDVGRVEEVLIHAKASLSLKRGGNRQDAA